ncbi:MAG: hypothetical protein ACOCP4_00660 [Candidatus Woesearchaeota archaeon]
MENLGNHPKFVKERIEDIALEYASDHPNIWEKDLAGKLWAIESSLWGLTKANAQLHKMIKILANKLEYDNEELFTLWTREIENE